MMKKNCGIFALLLAAATLAGCDDGAIPRKEFVTTHSGYTARLTGHITGADSWPDYYQLVLAGFGDSEYAVTQVQVSPDSQRNVNLALSDLGSDIRTVELCVTNRLRRRILTYQSADVAAAVDDTIHLEAGQLDAGMYTAIQQEIFNPTCAQCHGLSTTPAAGLYLTEGQSHASLVDQPATSVEGIRVIPGNADGSVLHQVIHPGNELDLGFSHDGMITSSAELRLIDEWINYGAKKQ